MVDSSTLASPLLLSAAGGHLILTQIYAIFFFKLTDDPVLDSLINIVATQMGIAIGRLDFNYSFANFRMEISKVPPPKS
jgi:hypothetical protein